MNDFGQGAAWAFRGIGEFFRHPRLWGFVAVPLLLVLVIYIGLFYAALVLWLPQLLSAIQNFFADRWFGFLYRATEILITVTTYAALIALTAFFAANIFEMLGGIAFSRLVRYYETRILGKTIVKLSIWQESRNLISCGIFSTLTLFIYLCFLIAGFFLPIIAPLLMILLIGYRYAVIYTSEAVFNSGHRLGEVPLLYRDKNGLLYGFGAVAFLIFLVPLLPIFLIPGLVIGGTLMYHHRKD